MFKFFNLKEAKRVKAKDRYVYCSIRHPERGMCVTFVEPSGREVYTHLTEEECHEFAHTVLRWLCEEVEEDE